MNSQNRLILSLKTAGLNHRQIKSVRVTTEPKQDDNEEEYPLMLIFPDGFRLSSSNPREVVYQFAVLIADRHKEDFSDAAEVLSDTALIMQDIVSTLLYVYRNEAVAWQVNGTAEPFTDNQGSITAGHAMQIEARMKYDRNFCDVPSNDYDFPSIDLDILVIDGGYYNSTYITPEIDGGIA